LVSGLWVIAIVIQEHFQLTAGWYVIAAYILLLFATIIFSFRPAWGKRVFWLSVGLLLVLHAVVGSLLAFLVPNWLHFLGSFLTAVVVADLLLTMTVLWRLTVRHGRKSL
jgi:hypothetical protein